MENEALACCLAMGGYVSRSVDFTGLVSLEERPFWLMVQMLIGFGVWGLR